MTIAYDTGLNGTQISRFFQCHHTAVVYARKVIRDRAETGSKEDRRLIAEATRLFNEHLPAS